MLTLYLTSVSLNLTSKMDQLSKNTTNSKSPTTRPVGEEVVNVQSVVLTGNGSYDYVKVLEWPLPVKCNPDEVRVAVEYCGVNFADVYHIGGHVLQYPVPYVLGLECAGKVTELGSSVGDLQVGDRVVCYSPNEAGMFRETVVVSRGNCFLIPPDICTKVACSLPANYLTAHFALFGFGNLRSGQSVLIHSAAGGVGWAATQLAANVVSNVRVLGTASASKHADIVKNGVTVPLTYDNYTTHITRHQVDVIIDNIGGDNFQKSIELLNPLGRAVLTGVNSVVQEDKVKMQEAVASLAASVVPMSELVTGNKSVCGLHLGTLLQHSPQAVGSAVQHLFTLCQQGLIEPRIHTIFPFNQASEAIKVLADRKNIGKVLLTMK